jgi:3,4-dihydroxy-2-butanone 4-phosphate synthase
MDQVQKVFSAGDFVMVYDAHREVEGDFFVLAESITPEQVHFLLREAQGLICVACADWVLDRLKIPLMVSDNEDRHGTNFCVSVDAKEGITTGVSVFDRCRTIRLLADARATRGDFVLPGHSFPLRAVSDLSVRFGHTEAAVELAKMCGKIPVVAICEILNSRGEKANLEELQSISRQSGIPLVDLETVRQWVLERDK